MYRPVEMMIYDLINSPTSIIGTGFEDTLIVANYTPIMFLAEKTYYDLNDAIANIKLLKNTIYKSVCISSTNCIIIVYLPDKDVMSSTNKIVNEIWNVMDYEYTREFATQACIHDKPNDNSIKISILYGESVKEYEESSDEIELPDFLKKQ